MGDPRRELLKQWREECDAVSADTALREFRNLARRTAIVESYVANWQARGVVREQLTVRIDHYRDRSEIKSHVFGWDERGNWEPAQTLERPLTHLQWEQMSAWVEFGFWKQPTRDAARPVMDGDCWSIEGYRDDRYHKVYRHTGSMADGSGAEVYELGRRLAHLAGLDRFEKKEE